MKEDSLAAMNAGRMTSLEIAELTGKQHKKLMQAIRKMEPAWEKVQGLKFQLSSRVYNLPNGGTKVVPYYSLTKTECLYIATRFNDEARIANKKAGPAFLFCTIFIFQLPVEMKQARGAQRAMSSC